ncbi:hypothetical protein ACWCQQ_31715 [Streptomyces sp. NPDC002143]
MRSKHLVGGAIAALAAVALPLAVPASSWASDASAAPVAAASTANEPSQAQWKVLNAASVSHHALGVFGGDGSRPVLRLPAGASASEKAKALADAPEGIGVTVKTSRFTANEVNQIQETVLDAKWNKDAAKYGLGASYDGETDQVVVNTDAPKSVTASLTKTYGDKVEVLQSRFEQQFTRFDDTVAYYGGDSVDSDHNRGPCTTGFKVHVANTYYVTTAGHCYNYNENIYNASQNGVHGEWIGRISHTDPDLDVIGISGGTYSTRIWSGGTANSTSNLQITGLGGMWKGEKVCVSGRTTFNHCGHPINAMNYGFNWTDHNGQSHHTNSWDGFTYDRGGTNAPNYNNGTLTQSGDSGAPIYVASSTSTAVAIGSHSGIVSWFVPLGNGGCGCTEYRMYGVKFGSVLSLWGAGMG